MEKYEELLASLPPDHPIPESFFAKEVEDASSCIFLISCQSKDRVLYMDTTCEELTGYSHENFLKKGMDFWFPLIHPDDLPALSHKIIRAHQELAAPGFDRNEMSPLVLEYRFSRPDGEWVEIRDTKYLLFPGDEPVIDLILCKFELVTPPQQEAVFEKWIRDERSCTKMLEFALVHQHSHEKTSLDEQPRQAPSSRQPLSETNPGTTAPHLTRREKEILRMIGKGLSSKMIADRCYISINTVETHRRHLLQKLQVKNSMQLIKEASKIFWL